MTGKQLKVMIDDLGITQRKLAEEMGVTPQTISAILTAKDVRTSTIERIADVTKMPISYFFREHDGQSAVASGDGSVAVTGNNNVAGNVTIGDAAVLQERVTMLERLLEEKERTIKILMER